MRLGSVAVEVNLCERIEDAQIVLCTSCFLPSGRAAKAHPQPVTFPEHFDCEDNITRNNVDFEVLFHMRKTVQGPTCCEYEVPGM